jgi:hypothetical protein
MFRKPNLFLGLCLLLGSFFLTVLPRALWADTNDAPNIQTPTVASKDSPTTESAATATNEAPQTQYVLEDVVGDVQVVPATGSASQPATEGLAVQVGDTVATSGNGSAVLALNEETNIRVDANSKVTVDKLQVEPTGRFVSMLKLLGGAILSQVEDLRKNNSMFEISSGGVVCGVRGTVFEVLNDGGQVQTVTHKGSVGVKSALFKEEFVEAGRAYHFRDGRIIHRRDLSDQDRQRFEAWKARRGHVLEKRHKRLELFRRLHPGAPGRIAPGLQRHAKLQQLRRENVQRRQHNNLLRREQATGSNGGANARLGGLRARRNQNVSPDHKPGENTDRPKALQTKIEKKKAKKKPAPKKRDENQEKRRENRPE